MYTIDIFFPLCLVVQNIWLQILCAFFWGLCQEQRKIRLDEPQNLLPFNYISVYILGLITMFALKMFHLLCQKRINILEYMQPCFYPFHKKTSHHLLFLIFLGLYVIWGLFFFQNGYCYWSSYRYF